MNTASSVARAILPSGAIELFESAAYARRYPPHFHDTYAIGLVEAGQVAIRTIRGIQVADPGSILLFAPGEIHSAHPMSAQGYGYRMVYPPPDLIHDMLARHTPLRFGAAVVQDFLLAVEIGRLFQSCANERGDAEDRLARVARRLSQAFADGGGARTRTCDDDAEIVGRAQAFARAHVDRMSLADLAGACGTTPFRLIRIFQRSLGVSPYAWMLQARLNRARSLLAQGVSIVNVALECGFADQSHMARAFRDSVGVPPGQYRRSVAHRTEARLTNPAQLSAIPATTLRP